MEPRAELQSLFDAIAENAALACGAEDALISLAEGGVFRRLAHYGPIAPLTDNLPIQRDNYSGRAFLDGGTVHVPDLLLVADPELAEARERAARGGYRAVLATSLRADGNPLGTLWMRRREARAFTEREIAQLETFARLAAIAIENARLNRELSESLERERATGEVLRIISRSPTELQTALDAIAEKAAEVCGTTEVGIRLIEGDMLTAVAHYGSMAVVMQELPLAGSVAGLAISRQRPEYVRDVLAPDALPFARVGAAEAGFRSILAVPLLREGQGIGVIIMRHPEPGPFSDKQIELLQSFADQAVIAIENARLFREINERNSELRGALERQTATAEVLQIISNSPIEVTPVYEAIAAAAARVLDASGASVWVRDGDELQLVARMVPREGLPDAGQIREVGYRESIHGGVGVSPVAVRERRTVHVPDRDELTGELGGTVPRRPNTGARSLLATPMWLEGEAVGAIGVNRNELRPFRPEEIALLETFAAQAVIAMENARLFNDLREALDQQTATAAVLGVIANSPTELQPVLDAIAEKAATVCGAADAAIRLVEGEMLRLVAHFGPLTVPPSEIALDSRSQSGRAVAEARPIHVADIRAVADQFPDAVARRSGSRTSLATPLKREGQPIGVILVRRTEVKPFSESQVALLQTFADQAVIAIENVRLFKELHERNDELRAALERQTATGEILRIISSSPTEVTPVYEAIGRAAARVLDAPNATVWVRDGDDLHVAARVAGRGGLPGAPELGQWEPISDGAGVSTMAVRERRTMHVPDGWELDDRAFGGWDRRARSTRPRSFLSTPMWLEGEPVGAIGVSRIERRPFSPEEIALLETFAAQAVIAMENVRLFHELEAKNAELEVAGKHKSDFLANMSHELRTPLNAIISFSEMLQEDAIDRGHADYIPDLQEINGAGKHLLGLINDILDLSKIEAGRMDLYVERFDLGVLIRDVQAMAQPLVEKNGNELVVDVPDDPGEMESDLTRVRQCLLNLLSNAAKFTEHGTVTLRVERANPDAPALDQRERGLARSA